MSWHLPTFSDSQIIRGGDMSWLHDTATLRYLLHTQHLYGVRSSRPGDTWPLDATSWSGNVRAWLVTGYWWLFMRLYLSPVWREETRGRSGVKSEECRNMGAVSRHGDKKIPTLTNNWNPAAAKTSKLLQMSWNTDLSGKIFFLSSFSSSSRYKIMAFLKIQCYMGQEVINIFNKATGI